MNLIRVFAAAIVSIIFFINACSSGGGGPYRVVHHHSPWFGYPGYYREYVVVVPDEIDEPIPIQLPHNPTICQTWECQILILSRLYVDVLNTIFLSRQSVVKGSVSHSVLHC